MTRIQDELVQRIKSEVSCLHLAERYGMEFTKKGKDYFARCPWHGDKTPSLSISPAKNLWKCLGACNTGGTVIDWEMKWHGVSFNAACERLKRYLGLSGDLACRAAGKSSSADPKLLADAANPELLKRVIAFYHATLKQSPEGLAYLDSRGVNDTALIDHFQLGLANRSLGSRLPDTQRKAGREIRGKLEKLGIYRASGHEHFNGSLVIPVLDARGQVREIYGRKIGQRLRKGTPKHLYLPGPHQGVFNLEALKASNEIILCESLIDALTFWAAGFRNVTSAYGVSGFTDELMQAFKDHGTERVLIAYDRDEAGNVAAEGLAKKLISGGMECFRIQFPKGMDANEYALKVTPADKSLGLVIRKAEWMGSGERPETTTDVGASTETHEAPEPIPATPVPEPPKVAIEAKVTDEEVIITLGDRRYRVRGLDKNTASNLLKINLMVSCGEALHIDSFDLYAMKPRTLFARQAAIELGVTEQVIKADLAKVLLKLELLQQEIIQSSTEPDKAQAVTLNDDEYTQAMALLQAPDLLDRIVSDFERCGVVGEATNKLVGYLACVSRKLDKPLALIVQSTTAAGKSTLMDAVLDLMPEEDRVQYSAMTGQSLFYMGDGDLKHKILAIAEEEGVQQAAYALKLLQSQGELTIASTGKDPDTGKLVTEEYKVEGPVMLFLTTTAIEIDEELMNRCMVLTVNESRAQTQAIHQIQRQRRTLDGLLAREDTKHLVHLHRNAQRLIRPLLVANPYAEQLTFLDDTTRTRRDHEKYLTLIESLALLQQHQRPIKTAQHNCQPIQYVEVTLNDIAIANRLAHEVLGRSLDELPPQTRRLLGLLRKMVEAQAEAAGMDRTDYRFRRRNVLDATRWSYDQVRVHISRLVELEYLLVHRGSRGQQFVYELIFDGHMEAEEPHLNGLIDTEKLSKAKKTAGTTRTLGGQEANFGGPLGPQMTPLGGSLGGAPRARKAPVRKGSSKKAEKNPKKALLGKKNNGASYRSCTSYPVV